jgi:ribosome-associated protein
MIDLLIRELKFKFTPSSGPGGQNVNKVSTRVEIRFNVIESDILSSDQKIIIIEKLGNKINATGDLIIICDETRSQIKNREIAISKFESLIEEALKPVKKRKATKPTKASKEKRLKEKKKITEKKNLRKGNIDV